MTKKNNKSFLQALMSLFKSQTKKQVTSTTSATKPVKKTKNVKKTKRVKPLPIMKGGMIRDGTVVQNMPKRS